MDRHRISTENAPAALGRYSQAIVANGFVFCSGTVGIDRQTGALGEGVAEQTEQVLLNLGTILKAAGSSLDHLVKTTIFYANVHAGIYRSGLYAAKSDGQPLTPEGAGTIARLIRRWLLRPFRTSAVRPVS